MPFPFEVYRCVHTRFFDEIEKLKVQKFVEQNYELFEKYIFSVTYNAIVTLMTQDTEAFLLRAAGYNDIRKRLDF